MRDGSPKRHHLELKGVVVNGDDPRRKGQQVKSEGHHPHHERKTSLAASTALVARHLFSRIHAAIMAKRAQI